jgi:hypothetical protein
MNVPVVLPQGDHALGEPVVSWLVHHVDANPPGVELIASIQSGLRQTSVPTRGETATTLAIQMDARVAIDLHRRLGELGRRMGWLPQK